MMMVSMPRCTLYRNKYGCEKSPNASPLLALLMSGMNSDQSDDYIHDDDDSDDDDNVHDNDNDDHLMLLRAHHSTAWLGS